MLKRVLNSVFLVAGLSSVAAFASPKIGEPAPAFTLKDASGKDRSLADYKGKIVVLEWINHDCPFVKKHYDAGNMQRIQKDVTGQDIVWLSIFSSAEGTQGHVTGKEALKLTADKKAAPTALLLDADGTVGRLYDAKVTPHMYVINEAGALVYNGAIDDQPSPKPASLEGANNFVLKAINETKAKKQVAQAVTKPYGCGVKYKN